MCFAPAGSRADSTTAKLQYKIRLYDSVFTDGCSQRELKLSDRLEVIDADAIQGPAYVLPVSLEQFLFHTYWCKPMEG